MANEITRNQMVETNSRRESGRPEERTARPKRILLADDSQTMLIFESMILNKMPYELVTARNGIEAVETANRQLPDLILMDIVMPLMDGIAACKAIRSHPATRHIPVILLSTRHEEELTESAFRSGCSDFLIKPFNKIEILSIVKRHLGD